MWLNATMVRSTRRQMLEAFDVRPEHQPDERRDDREADAPPAVQLAPGHERHASVRLMDVLAIRDLAAAQRDRYLAALRTMVNIDSGTFNRAGVNRIADLCEARFREGGWDVERIGPTPGDQPELGDQLVGTFRGAGRARVLMVGHMDTVFDDGTAAERPFSVHGERAYGPGVSDMKRGLLAGFFAVDVLRDARVDGFERITYVCNPDEEIGSPSSDRDDQATRSRTTTRRSSWNPVVPTATSSPPGKGTTDYAIRIHGRAAHAGVEPGEGRSAVIEAAHKAIEIADIHGRWPGVTCNIGVLRGGTRSNVVAEEAVLEVDLRSPELATLEEAKRAIEADLCRTRQRWV